MENNNILTEKIKKTVMATDRFFFLDPEPEVKLKKIQIGIF
jgi:hypothetical protein